MLVNYRAAVFAEKNKKKSDGKFSKTCIATQFTKSDITLPPGKKIDTSLLFYLPDFRETTPPGTDCPVEFFGFFGTRKFERVTPSNAFKKTHRDLRHPLRHR